MPRSRATARSDRPAEPSTARWRRATDPLAATTKKGRVRAEMWADALAAHQAGRVRATEARAADFFGPGVIESHLGERTVPRVLAGKSASVLGDPDVAHSFTYVPDVARTLVVLGRDEQAWGRAWHVPSPPALSQREALHQVAAIAGAAPGKVRGLPSFALAAGGLFVPFLRELKEVAYQFDQPFILDSSDTERTLGLTATPLDQALTATVEWFRGQQAAAA